MLRLYDFEFFAWPVDFRWNESDIQPMNVQEINEKHNEMSYFRRIINAPYKFLE